MIHAIGDDHVWVFSGKEQALPEAGDSGFLPFFTVHCLGTIGLDEAAESRGLIESVIERDVGPGDSVMLCFGQRECWPSLDGQSVGRDAIRDLVSHLVDRYASLFDIKEKYRTKLIIWNAVPTAHDESQDGEPQTREAWRRQNEAIGLFNTALAEECGRRGVLFVSIFDHLLDADGLTRNEYYVDDTHLSQRAMPLILDAFRNQELIDAPLKALEGESSRSEDQQDVIGRFPESTDGRKVLVWCGVRDIARLIARRAQFDLCYVIEAEREWADRVRAVYCNDKNVIVREVPALNLLAFYNDERIGNIHTLVVHAKENGLALLRTLDRLLHEERIGEIECEIEHGQMDSLASILGDAYRIVPEADPAGEGFRTIRCILKSRKRLHSRQTREEAVINVVYAHLSDEQGCHPARRGCVSVAWSRFPLAGCQMYLYLNAYGFIGKQDAMDVLYLSEPTIVLPGQYDTRLWSHFDHVITPYDSILGMNDKSTKCISARKGNQEFFLDGTVTEDRTLRKQKYPLEGRINGICMINGNKQSSLAGELYSARLETARWFGANSTIPFDVFGNPSFALPNYRGVLEPDAKLSTLAMYRYSLAFDNTNHPVFAPGYVDKILSCLETRTVPIHCGAPNIDSYVPRECFIDFRSFHDSRELEMFLNAMTDEEYLQYIEAIDRFVEQGGLRAHSTETFYDQLIQLYAEDGGVGIESLYSEGEEWEYGLSPTITGRLASERKGVYLWPWEVLCSSLGDVLTDKGGNDLAYSEKEAIASSVDRLGPNSGEVPSCDFQSTIDRIQVLIERGAADVNDRYTLAQCFIAQRDFDRALDALHQVVSLMPGHTFALNDMGVIHLGKQKRDAAVSFFERSFLADRSNHNALKNLLAVLESVGDKAGLQRALAYVDHRALSDTTDDRAIAGMLERNKGFISGNETGAPIRGEAAKPLSGSADRKAARRIQIMDPSHISSDTRIGDYTYIGFGCYITKATIGRYCSIANCVKIGQGEHRVDAVSTSALFYDHPYEQLTSEECIIGNDVWIGIDSIIKRGVRVGDGCIIGANSFVNSDIPDYAIAVGSPARVVRFRFPPEKVALLKSSSWWNFEIDEAREVVKILEREMAGEEAPQTNARETTHVRLAVLVFSKDRAMQLECTLGTFLSHCADSREARIRVIYTTSNYFHERGYEKLKNEFPSVEFVKEKEFKSDVLSFLSSCEHVLFLVDDNVFVSDFRLYDAVEAMASHQPSIGFSLRLGRNTTYSYMQSRTQALPDFSGEANGCLSFDWTTSELDFGYPLEVSSSVYRVSDIFPMLRDLEFRNPNTLEALMDLNKTMFASTRPKLLCYESSVAFCNPSNKVQNVFTANRAGSDSRKSPERLENMFLKGYRIDGKGYDGFVPRACHQELDFGFRLRTNGSLRPGKQHLADRPVVSIVIPNFNGLKHITICLDSIQRNTPEDHEIIVVDNGSTDGSLEYLRTVSGIVLIENPENVGAPGARNQALSIAQGDYVIFMDNDTIATRDWISRFVDHAERNPDVGIIGACTNYATGLQRVADADSLSYSTIGELESYAAKRGEEHRGQLIESPRLISFCIFLRRGVIEKIGGMDTSFSKFCFEDDDYSIRATVAGLKSVVALDVFIHHTGGPQGRGDKDYNDWLAQAWEGFRRKWRISESAGFGQYDPHALASREFVQSDHYVPLPDREAIVKLVYRVHPGEGASDQTKEPRFDSAAEDHFNKALAHEEAGDSDLAIEELERVLAIDDGYAGAYDGLGVLYYRKGDMQKALQMLSVAVMLQPGDVTSMKNLAAVALEAGETEDAIGLYQAILSLEPEDIEALLVTGRLCEQNGQAENALGFLERVLEKDPANREAAEAVERIRKLGRGDTQAQSQQRGAAESSVLG